VINTYSREYNAITVTQGSILEQYESFCKASSGVDKQCVGPCPGKSIDMTSASIGTNSIPDFGIFRCFSR
jgi:hypothetical protein